MSSANVYSITVGLYIGLIIGVIIWGVSPLAVALTVVGTVWSLVRYIQDRKAKVRP